MICVLSEAALQVVIQTQIITIGCLFIVFLIAEILTEHKSLNFIAIWQEGDNINEPCGKALGVYQVVLTKSSEFDKQ